MECYGSFVQGALVVVAAVACTRCREAVRLYALC